MAIETGVGPEPVTVNGTAGAVNDSAPQLMLPDPAETPVTVRPLTVAAAVLLEVQTGPKQLRVDESLIVVVQVRPWVPPAATVKDDGVTAMDTAVGPLPGS
jgi:hypothetical protein